MSGMYFNAVGYQLNEQTGTIDYEDMERKALEHRPEAHHRRRLGLFARMGLQTYARNRRQGGRAAAHRHGPHGRTDRRRPAGQPREIRPYRHLDDAQDPARPARRYHPHGQGFRQSVGLHHTQRRRQEDVATAQLGRLPRHSGRPARTRDRRQGRRFRRSARARIQGVPGAGAEECQGHGRSLRQTRLQNRFGRYGQLT